jgi:hypothetical protein
MEMFTLPFALFLAVGAVALFSFISVATWSDNRRREREAYYKNETLRKLAEMPSADALTILREEEAIDSRKRQEGQRLGGLITVAVGIGIIIFFSVLAPEKPVHIVGIIPLLVGCALLCYSYMLAPKR